MIRIRPMTEADLPLGLRLTAQAGWNQTEADWRRFLRLAPHGCFVAEWDGAAVGTTVWFNFSPWAWVAMVLVDEAVRGRGIGKALMQHLLALFDGRGVKSVRLDATPLGRPIYEKLGFLPEYTLVRYEGVLPPPRATVSGVEPVPTEGLSGAGAMFGICLLVTHVMLAPGWGELPQLILEAPDRFRIVQGVNPASGPQGLLAARPGANAIQLGPLMARSERVGGLLLADAQQRFAGQRVFIDVPLPNRAAVSAVEALGLRPQRELLRMGRGVPVRENLDLLWATSGPEKG